MADATVKGVEVALCPNCGTQRLFYYEGPGNANPTPIGPPTLAERNDVIKDFSEFSVVTGWTKKTITDGTADWSDNEHKGKVVDVRFKDGSDVIESHVIESNDSTTLTMKTRLRGKHLLPVDSPRPSGLFYNEDPPYYRLRSDDRTSDSFKAKVNTKRWSNSQFICNSCQTIYDVP